MEVVVTSAQSFRGCVVLFFDISMVIGLLVVVGPRDTWVQV